MNKAKWSSETSGAYTKYVSIAEERTSLRRNSNAKFYIFYKYFTNLIYILNTPPL